MLLKDDENQRGLPESSKGKGIQRENTPTLGGKSEQKEGQTNGKTNYWLHAGTGEAQECNCEEGWGDKKKRGAVPSEKDVEWLMTP